MDRGGRDRGCVEARRPERIGVLSRSQRRRGGWGASLRSTTPYELRAFDDHSLFAQVDARLAVVPARAEDGASSGTRHTLQSYDATRPAYSTGQMLEQLFPESRTVRRVGSFAEEFGAAIRAVCLFRIIRSGHAFMPSGSKRRWTVRRPHAGALFTIPRAVVFPRTWDQMRRGLSRHLGRTFGRPAGSSESSAAFR
jgi:hypothetical protein